MNNFIVNSFQVPNAVVDNLIAEISGNELKCYLIIVRKTKGWQKQEDAISLTQFENLTNLSRSVIIGCCKVLEEKGLIESRKGYRNTTVYKVKDSTSEENELVKNMNQSLVKKLNRSSEENELVTSKETEHTKYNIKNNIQNNIDHHFDRFWCAGLPKINKSKSLKLFLTKFKNWSRTNKSKTVDDFTELLVIDIKKRLESQFGFSKLHPTTYLNNQRWEDEIIQQSNLKNIKKSTEWINDLESEVF